MIVPSDAEIDRKSFDIYALYFNANGAETKHQCSRSFNLHRIDNVYPEKQGTYVMALWKL